MCYWIGHDMPRRRGGMEMVIKGFTVWMMGLPCSGKTTLSNQLYQHDTRTVRLDGDIVRSGLCSDLGFSPEDRIENIRRMAHIAKHLNDQGFDVVGSFLTPSARTQDLVKEIIGDQLILVYVKCPVNVCEARDVKGMYAKARKGEIKYFTGVDAPFVEPVAPDITVDTSLEGVLQTASQLQLDIDWIMQDRRRVK
jgi:adenylylsulfate kinase